MGTRKRPLFFATIFLTCCLFDDFRRLLARLLSEIFYEIVANVTYQKFQEPIDAIVDWIIQNGQRIAPCLESVGQVFMLGLITAAVLLVAAVCGHWVWLCIRSHQRRLPEEEARRNRRKNRLGKKAQPQRSQRKWAQRRPAPRQAPKNLAPRPPDRRAH